jgi:hypothetical protein
MPEKGPSMFLDCDQAVLDAAYARGSVNPIAGRQILVDPARVRSERRETVPRRSRCGSALPIGSKEF